RDPAMGQPQALPVEVPPEPAAVPLTFSDVFIPNAAWPATGHHSESFPPVTFTVSVRVAPGAMEGSLTVDLRPAPARSSLCTIVPALCTTNLTLPALLEDAERPMWYSRSVTLIVTVAAELPAATAATAAPASASATATPSATNAVLWLCACMSTPTRFPAQRFPMLPRCRRSLRGARRRGR